MKAAAQIHTEQNSWLDEQAIKITTLERAFGGPGLEGDAASISDDKALPLASRTLPKPKRSHTVPPRPCPPNCPGTPQRRQVRCSPRPIHVERQPAAPTEPGRG
eukprot:CAMPEP_0113678114 /NCGR_PEP_ID=MMETSP0038_2-20120614/9721_1 /TAXON_ID=2898 /ORGANISM="Cryptomonas paramecium" /LENGTH=103 /DNA_ID=CAMNT_0000595623 /DNA_START=709 /DNA_END=1016 /DNA_ORIENTATION=+ /assembly_acc=CAM_ASM_000170